MSRERNLVLVGFMGTGKTVVGKAVAGRLGRAFVDLDSLVEEHSGCTAAQLFEREGEAGFRARERRAVLAVSRRSGLVIATGGGVVLDPDNLRDLERNGDLVCLTATPETILKRVADDAARPLLQGGAPLARIQNLLAARQALYAVIPLQVATDALRPAEVVEEILRRLGCSAEK